MRLWSLGSGSPLPWAAEGYVWAISDETQSGDTRRSGCGAPSRTDLDPSPCLNKGAPRPPCSASRRRPLRISAPRRAHPQGRRARPGDSRPEPPARWAPAARGDSVRAQRRSNGLKRRTGLETKNGGGQTSSASDARSEGYVRTRVISATPTRRVPPPTAPGARARGFSSQRLPHLLPPHPLALPGDPAGAFGTGTRRRQIPKESVSPSSSSLTTVLLLISRGACRQLLLKWLLSHGPICFLEMQ